MADENANSVYLSPADCSLVNAVGLTTAAVSAAVAAGISRLEESSIYNKQFNPMKLSLIPDEFLPELKDSKTGYTSRQNRMLQLASLAVSNLLADRKQAPLPILLAGPERLYTDDTSPVIDRDFVTLLNSNIGGGIEMERVGLNLKGRAGGIYALRDAILHMHKANVEEVLLVGVDSYLDLRLLASLDKEDRVMAAGVMDGFFPGEGAAALLLTLKPKPDSVKLHLPGVADEPGHRFSDEPYRGDGLSQAVNTALTNAGLQNIQSIWCSLNGENLGAKEWGVSFTRNHSYFADGFEMNHPAEYFGDIGAAYGPSLMALAIAMSNDQSRQDPILVWASSERAERAAVVVGNNG